MEKGNNKDKGKTHMFQVSMFHENAILLGFGQSAVKHTWPACTNAFPRLNLECLFISWKNAAFPQHVQKATRKP